MNITDIDVPFGIRFISEWKEFTLQRFPHIIDKQIPGCGFTEYCLTNDMDLILTCPRKMILKNKENQHEGQVYYAESFLSSDPNVDKDISVDTKIGDLNSFVLETKKKLRTEEAQKEYLRLKNEIQTYWYMCQSQSKPCKILVTYDSYRKVRGILEEAGIFNQFYTVVDEFQSIFVDSRFKSSAELEFISALRGIMDVCYVSATPMLETYLDQISEFKDLPYYRLNWIKLDPGRVAKPALKIYTLKSITTVVKKVVAEYRAGKGESAPVTQDDGSVRLVKSKEAVFYINSINGICRGIKGASLMPWEVNILCADTPENRTRMKKLTTEMEDRGFDLKEKSYEIGEVPLKGQPHKMFTFCTRTVYLGADFYSDNARSWILSDANIDSLAVDISLDLPQILGRQRLIENPWKNQANLYIKVLRTDKKSMEEFENLISKKKDASTDLLKSWETGDESQKMTLADMYERDALSTNYRYSYVAVNRHSGSSPKPVFNMLALVAEQRAYDIQQTDYADRFSVFSRLASVVGASEVNAEILKFQKGFEQIGTMKERLRYLCEFQFSSEVAKANVLDFLPEAYRSFYVTLGPKKCRSVGYDYSRLKKLMGENLFDQEKIKNRFLTEFKVGEKYPKSDLKNQISQIYKDLNYTKTPKATDIEDWFEVKTCKIKDFSGKWVHGLELVKLK